MTKGANRMKKRWGTLRIVLLLTATAIVSTAAALAGEEDGNSSVLDKLSSRVAAILGLDEKAVDAAIKQARAELKQEAVQAKLAAYEAKLTAMVEKGQLTQEQADEKATAFQSKLEAAATGVKKPGAIDAAAIKAKLAAYQAKLASMVEEGALTQDEADKKLEAFQSKPKKAVVWKKVPIEPEAVEAKLAGYQTKLAGMIDSGALTQDEADRKLEAVHSKLENAAVWD